MKPISIEFNDSSSRPLYLQLYDYLKNALITRDLEPGEKLPSLRNLSRQLGISITTVQSAYNQLMVEGYIENQPQSGYYASDLKTGRAPVPARGGVPAEGEYDRILRRTEGTLYRYDLESFDFVKWKKCMSSILTDHPARLLSEGDRQGEPVLREEISRYAYLSRGVVSTPDQVVISAGTQSLMNHLSRILQEMDIGLVATENPGYLPVQNIFRDRGFTVARIPVAEDGIVIEKLPENIPAAVYVMPSNQFPTGTVMPVGRRYELLEWAKTNRSIIIEDDYDSELRYFGRPVPALQGLSPDSDVVYLGSFSSTLFAGIRLSYMILPGDMSRIFREKIMRRYDQTSSKTEQLTLAEFMHRGWYRTEIRKMRKLYARKLSLVLRTIEESGGDFVRAVNKNSGINITLHVRSGVSPRELCAAARALRLQVIPQTDLMEQESADLIFYYNQIPLGEIREAVEEMIAGWRELEKKSERKKKE